MKFFSKRDIWVLLFGVLLIQVLSCGLINQFMVHPVKNGYDKSIDGYVDIGTNGISIAARLIGFGRDWPR